MVNLFPEVVPEGGKEPGFLSRCPGLALLDTIGSGPIRGLWVLGSLMYVVSGTTLYSVTTGYVETSRGTIAGTGPVSIADNGLEIFIATSSGTSYIYTVATTTLTEITDPGFPGAITVGYINGWFVFNEPSSQKIWVKDAATVLDASNFSSADALSDNVVGLVVDHNEVWIFGNNSTEVWYDAGTSGFPLARISGAISEIGCASAYTIAKMDNTVFWLGKDARGQGIVYRAKGYGAERVSTHAVEWQIQSYGDLSTALAYTYQQDGHSFYVLIFPGEDTTWVYDAATNAWHERAGFSNGSFTRHRSNCQAFFNNLTIVGDYSNGKIYSLDLGTYADDGSTQKWLRSWRALPAGANNLTRAAHHSLQLDCEAGVGLPSGQGSDPQVMMRWSDDGGHTWTNEQTRSMGQGALGQYGYRVIWRRLGMTMKLRDRVYEVSGTDPVKIIIMGAELLMSPTNA